MVRTIIFIVLACVGLTALLSYCAPTQQGTLTLNPGPTFPDMHKTELGRTIARILPFCPGMSMVGKELVFTNLEMHSQGEANATRVTFSVPDVPAIPSAWGTYDLPCEFTVEGNFLYIRGASCQAICLGKQPDEAVDILSVNLNPKARNKQ